MEENTSLHTECAHKPRPAVLNQFSRTELLLGEDNMQRLFNARVAVFGIGGVGGYTVEALARVGVGTLSTHIRLFICRIPQISLIFLSMIMWWMRLIPSPEN